MKRKGKQSKLRKNEQEKAESTNKLFIIYFTLIESLSILFAFSHTHNKLFTSPPAKIVVVDIVVEIVVILLVAALVAAIVAAVV